MNRQEVKVFSIAVEEPGDPIPFQLDFEKPDGSNETHDFLARPEMGAGGQLSLASMVHYNDGKEIIDLGAVLVYLKKALYEDDFERLNALLNRDDLVISMDTLGELFKWLIEEQTGRPTERSKSSSVGPRTTSRKSTARLSSAG